MNLDTIVHGAAATCANCGADEIGRYCPRCGQKRVHDGDLSIAHAWRHIINEMVDVDGRILTTLKILFRRPGQLTLDFLEGRRARYIHPLRLFLVFSAIYFVAEGRPYSATILHSNVLSSARQALKVKASHEGVAYETLLRRVEDRAHVAFKTAFIASVIANGVCLWLFFRRRRAYLAENMVTALHLSCVAMTVNLSMGVLGRWLNLEAILAGIAAGALIAYGTRAAQRVYAGERSYKFGLSIGAIYLADLVIVIGATILAIRLSAA